MNTDDSHYIHLVSDATGETLETVTKAALVQFEGVKIKKRLWPMVRTVRQGERLIQKLSRKPGLVLLTMIDDDVRQAVIAACREASMPALDVLDPVINTLADYFGQEALGAPGEQYRLDSDYFERIDAMQYALAHDDGQAGENIGKADIILVGVSRTSKTPTSMYLANRGLRVANIPFVREDSMPKALDHTDAFVACLTVSPDRLVTVRSNRLRSMQQSADGDYVDRDSVRNEILACKRYCARRGWPVLDVTRRSIEETAAAVMNQYYARKSKETG